MSQSRPDKCLHCPVPEFLLSLGADIAHVDEEKKQFFGEDGVLTIYFSEVAAIESHIASKQSGDPDKTRLQARLALIRSKMLQICNDFDEFEYDIGTYLDQGALEAACPKGVSYEQTGQQVLRVCGSQLLIADQRLSTQMPVRPPSA